ncbi:MAG: hypothetical protein ACYC2H_10040, partial [Thermoplasmatota archaeon]
MRPLASLAAFTSLLVILAGCTSDSPAPPGQDEVVAPTLPEGVVAFRGNESVPFGGPLGQALALETGFAGAEPNMGITSSGPHI